MDTATEVLVIILSVTLTIFLIIAIVAFVYIIKLMKQVGRITERAENVADSVEAAAAAFERTASPLAILKIIGNIVDQATKFRNRKGQ